ncbi:MAG: decaprenyl-phosphate phosphoribosyltransferase [Paracoccaceae bacterium]
MISRSSLSGVFKLVRPKQWVKNTFVLAPLIFSGLFMDVGSIINVSVAVFLFCVASSATYIVNDMYDIEYDRRHPHKSISRPLASGEVSILAARLLLFLLYSILVVGWFIYPLVVSVIAAYLLLNLAYSLFLKHQPVIDIFTIAIGFVLRVYAGAVALNVEVSSWMFITTLCLALYLASIKRRQELRHMGSEGRKVLQNYSFSLVDRYAEISSIGALLFYSIFVMSSKPELVVSVPLVLFGLFRYWFVVETLDGGESPTDALVDDWQLLLTVVVWAVVCTWALWPVQD